MHPSEQTPLRIDSEEGSRRDVPDIGGARALGAIALNLMLEEELRTIVRSLSRHAIDLIVLKGIPLALRLFDRVDARVITDNDLLVHARDVVRACDVLRELGYEPVDARTVASQIPRDFQYRMGKPIPGGGWLRAEIHWNAFPTDLHPVPEDLLWAHREPFRAIGLDVGVFDRPLTLVHLASHFAQDHFANRQTLRDVAQAWNRWYAEHDASDLVSLAAETGLTHTLDFALLSASDAGLLAGPPPPIGSRRAARLRRLLPAGRLFEPRPEKDYRRWLYGLLLTEPRHAARWLRRSAFPPLETLAAWSEKPPSARLYARYLVRPFRPLRALWGRERS